ncbi:Krueppel-like factor 7 [Dermatophagoides pteronyssinus]|uniref:Krueppel-like factor 7 n=1 Tax=Dermatophagoides pteronyssinus TaxID=6956 RepID=UPI003F67AC23
MDILPSGHFFKELQAIHDTGYLPAHLSLEDKWEQTMLELERYLKDEPKSLLSQTTTTVTTTNNNNNDNNKKQSMVPA